MSYYFFITFLEWFEFNVYNSTAAYLKDIIGSTNPYLANLTILISFFLRPVGSIFFSKIQDRNRALRISLVLMISATLGLACTPNYAAIGPVWMLVCKSMQGFALGGSYGLSYLSTYEVEETLPFGKRWTNYKIAILQVGWVLGCMFGKLTVFLFSAFLFEYKRIFQFIRHCGDYILYYLGYLHSLNVINFVPGDAFLRWGWRVPFAFSAILASVLLCFKGNLKNSKVQVAKPKLSLNIAIITLLLSCIEFVLFYTNLFSQMQLEKMESIRTYAQSLSCLQECLMIILFPTIGLILDLINRFCKRDLNLFWLVFTLMMFVYYGKICLEPSIAISTYAAFMLSLCYAALIPAIISFVPKQSRLLIGPIINLGAIFGGLVQFLARIWFENVGNLRIFVIMMTIPILCGLIIAIWVKVQAEYKQKRE